MQCRTNNRADDTGVSESGVEAEVGDGTDDNTNDTPNNDDLDFEANACQWNDTSWM